MLHDTRLPNGFPDVITAADERISIDTSSLTVSIDGISGGVTPMQADVLLAQAMSLDGILSFDELSRRVYGIKQPKTEDPLRMAISSLRKNMGPELGHPVTGALRTKRGLGYYLVRSLAGRVGDHYEDDKEKAALADQRIRVFPTYGLVQVEGRPVEAFTALEFAVLKAIAQNPDQILSTSTIDGAAPAIDHAKQRKIPAGVNVAIYSIRSKLGAELGDLHKGAIRTVAGLGYMGVSSLAA